MNKFKIIWNKIKNDKIDYTIPDAGSTDTNIYITDNYVFKSGSGVDRSFLINVEARNIGVKVPKAVYCSPEKNVVAYERITGDMLHKLEHNKMLEAGFKTGKEVKKLHQKEYNGYGDITDLETFSDSEYQNYREFFKSQKDYTKNVGDNSKYKQYVEESVEIANSITVPEKTVSSLLHNDIDPSNVLVEDGSAYIIDFERSYFGEGKTDFLESYIFLRKYVGEEIAESFASGYGEKISNLNDYHLCEVVFGLCRGGWRREKNNLELDGRESDIKQLLTMLRD
jgi:tRNA A-37 threonylcarbamoyl transferase component Bud32